MAHLVEKDSDTPALVLISALILLLIGAILGFAYKSGAFEQKATVVANIKMAANKTVATPDEVHLVAPPDAMGPEKPAPSPGR